MFKNLTINEIPMVRKFAAKGLGNFLRVLPLSLEKEILDMVNNVIKDDQDLVRVYMVDALLPLAGLIPQQKHQQIIIPMFNTLADDQSWRIKYSICEKSQEVKKKRYLFGCYNLGFYSNERLEKHSRKSL